MYGWRVARIDRRDTVSLGHHDRVRPEVLCRAMSQEEAIVSVAGPRRDLVLTEDLRRLVGKQRLGFGATVCPDGIPSLSPEGTTAVWDDEHLDFADIRSPETADLASPEGAT